MKYKLNQKFERLLFQHRTCLTWFARDHGVPIGTLRAALRPDQHRGRKGNVRGLTAHKIVDGYARIASISAGDAWAELIEEIEE